MSSRHTDLAFIGLVLAVLLVAYFLTQSGTDRSEGADGQATYVIPDFSLPPLAFEIPFEFPYAIVEFERRVAPKLKLSSGMESALGEVRSALLASSLMQEADAREEWVAALE